MWRKRFFLQVALAVTKRDFASPLARRAPVLHLSGGCWQRPLGVTVEDSLGSALLSRDGPEQDLMEQGLPLKGHCGWIRGPHWYDDMGMVASGGIDTGGYRFLSFLPIVSSFPSFSLLAYLSIWVTFLFLFLHGGRHTGIQKIGNHLNRGSVMRSVAIELVQMVEDASFPGSGEHEWQRRDQFERFLVGFLRQ